MRVDRFRRVRFFGGIYLYKKIGILGGLSPESTVIYYLRIVRRYQELFGDHSYPEIIIYSGSATSQTE